MVVRDRLIFIIVFITVFDNVVVILRDHRLARQDRRVAHMAKKWYVIHTYSGYENKVKANLEHRIQSMGMAGQDLPGARSRWRRSPSSRTAGRKVTSEKKVFPGYILVQMELDDESWYVVRNTPGVTGFVGSQGEAGPALARRGQAIIKRTGSSE